MTFQALLFCPDEKTARVATQVLNELEFSVEACNEPFAAVKKLMGKHFDAVVVDCENEQNASLLFKSARNSAANQGALAVAVVEGQAGVANAFRVGANLVLTKPINVEQAKSTLRVARGLLRKGTDTKAPAAVPPATAATPASKPAISAAKTISTPNPTPKPLMPAPPKAKPAPPVMAAKKTNIDAGDLFESDGATSSPEEESLLETAEEKSPAPAQEYPWQPVSKPAGAIASSPQRAPVNVGKSSLPIPQAPKSTAPAQKAPPAVPAGSHGGAASAPAPAMEVTRTTPALFAGQTAAANQPSAQTSTELFTGVAEPPEPLSAPSFAALDLQEERNQGGGAKKGIIIAVAAVVLAAAAYFGYTKFAGSKPAQPIAPVASQPQAAAPAEEPAGQELDITVGGQGSTSTEAPQQVIIERTPVRTSPAPKGSAATSASASSKPSVDQEEEVTTTHPDTPRLVVKSDLGAAKPASAQQPTVAEAVAPPALGNLGGEEGSGLPSIVKSAPASVPRVAPAPGMIKVSQGVTQGLILKRVQPVYPQQALQMRVHGAVQLQAEISKTGAISNIKVLSGDAVLARAAVQAVSQWKYKPYFLNGEPVDIQTQITVNFKLPSE